MSAVQDIKKVVKDIEDKVKETGDRKNMLVFGLYALNLIKARTRKGFGVPDVGANQKRLPPLSASYIKYRSRRRLSPFTSPRKSNVTLSGRLLSGLRVYVSKSRITIKPTGTSEKGESNDQVASYLEKQGRVFLRLSKSEILKVIKFYNENILNKVLK